MAKQYVVEENSQFLLLNKKAGIPSVPDQTGDNSLLDIMTKKKNITLYPIHRIDRPVSGLVIFGKSKGFTRDMSALFQTHKVDKTYLAITEKKLDNDQGTLMAHLKHDTKRRRAEVDEGAEPNASLHYTFKAASDRYFLYEVEIEGGKFHQVRVMLANAGCPIKGDVKYGARRGNKDRSICLHAHTMRFINPKYKREENHTAQFPDDNLWLFFKEALGEEE